jgi:hypothetical protein
MPKKAACGKEEEEKKGKRLVAKLQAGPKEKKEDKPQKKSKEVAHTNTHNYHISCDTGIHSRMHT